MDKIGLDWWEWLTSRDKSCYGVRLWKGICHVWEVFFVLIHSRWEGRVERDFGHRGKKRGENKDVSYWIHHP